MGVEIAVGDVFLESDYEHTIEIHSDYKLLWSIVDDDIRLAMRCKTTGWIAFGIGEPSSGSMNGADMVVANVDDEGKVHVSDRYAVDFVKPEEDESSDWTATGGWESNGYTTVAITRKLNTGDAFDRALVNDGFEDKVMVAWGSGDTFAYHGANRYIGRIDFFNANQGNEYEAVLTELQRADTGLATWNITNDDYEIPEKRTTYRNVCFKIPEDMYVVSILDILPPETKEFVHHFTVETFRESDDCSQDMFDQMVVYAGPGHFFLPKDVAIFFGAGIGGVRSINLQTHYDNPKGINGIKCNSGVTFVYSKTPRQYEAGILQLGDPLIVMNGQALPRGKSRYSFECGGDCSAHWNQPEIKVFAQLLHMHQFGSSMTTEVFHGEKIIKRTSTEFYSFTNMDTNKFEPYTIQKGDSFRTTCDYDTKGQEATFGLGSDQEMCIDFVYYYPRIPSADVGAYCGMWTCGSALDVPVDVPPRSFAYIPPPPTPPTVAVAEAPTIAPAESKKVLKAYNAGLHADPATAVLLLCTSLLVVL